MAGALVAGADEASSPWATNTHPTDKERAHLEEIATSRHQYHVVQGGTMDGRNCPSPVGCCIARGGSYLQTWDSNRPGRMQNAGETDVVTPSLSNARNNFRRVSPHFPST